MERRDGSVRVFEGLAEEVYIDWVEVMEDGNERDLLGRYDPGLS